MKSRFPFLAIVILGLGLVAGVWIMQMDRQASRDAHDHGHESASAEHDAEHAHDSKKESDHEHSDDSDHTHKDEGHSGEHSHDEVMKRGPHGGWMFAKDDFQLEVSIFESGTPPQFRVYPTKLNGEPIPLEDVDLAIELKRLDRTDRIHFAPMRDYLLGQEIVVEPHSFEMEIRSRWRERVYTWHHSQIEARVELPENALKNSGITIEKAGPQTIKTNLRLTGEIELNEEKVVHIVPRLNGVVKKVFKDLGDQVKRGELLAIIESRELADAKINYLAAMKHSKLAAIDLEREKQVFDNTRAMLNLLEEKLETDEVYRRLNTLVIGQNRETLIPAYAKLQWTESVYLREKRLFDKGISSESDYLRALEDHKSAEAKYRALREKIAYDGDWAIQQKQKKAEMEELNLQTAIQKLLAIGLSRKQIERLGEHDEPTLTYYELRSTLGGTVIQKHLTTGEAVGQDDNIFVLADLSDVWANIAIPANDLKGVKLGQSVRIYNDVMGIEGLGRLTYLDSVIDVNTRTVTGRVVVANPDRLWRPGTFIGVDLVLDERTAPVAVKRSAIQSLRDWSVVFVKYGDLFEGRPLELGVSDGVWVEVTGGLSAGESYAVENSFTIKAEIEKSGAVHQH
ncbi:MAG: HlyD family efflux transporter periplasmic adaptor subunit [Candidatus Nitrohelix vancouverensis]|uniref:HlyD family efflux transporter periplasmic adaptor subunit n=1 Tax=Candidatus Nitrohelix vancouverensis TaxID=2705534 RepID=A0A7T0C0E2_9BACT|nr:MAG: HlyD family efflux transporter periplasmic adaptor subunit [Candidatus Nitrohelix vancouverensis]